VCVCVCVSWVRFSLFSDMGDFFHVCACVAGVLQCVAMSRHVRQMRHDKSGLKTMSFVLCVSLVTLSQCHM